MRTVSLGPAIAVVALKNTTGSAGSGILLSAAWSRKFKPMQTILLGRAIGGPNLVVGAIRGAVAAFRPSQSRNRSMPPLLKNASP